MNIIAGDLGIVCNAIHYMDLFEYLSGYPIVECISDLCPWKNVNKRGMNYKEFSCVFIARDLQNNILTICFDPSHNGNVNIILNINGDKILLSEGCGTEYCSTNRQIKKRAFEIIPTSRLTAKIIIDILSESSLLPSIAHSKNIHTHLFKQINRALGLKNTAEVLCPIT